MGYQKNFRLWMQEYVSEIPVPQSPERRNEQAHFSDREDFSFHTGYIEISIQFVFGVGKRDFYLAAFIVGNDVADCFPSVISGYAVQPFGRGVFSQMHHGNHAADRRIL